LFWPGSRTAQANVRLCEAGLGRSSDGPSASDQRHNPDYEEQKEKNLGDSSGRAGDAPKPSAAAMTAINQNISDQRKHRSPDASCICRAAHSGLGVCQNVRRYASKDYRQKC
jgi:hypothetical protein